MRGEKRGEKKGGRDISAERITPKQIGGESQERWVSYATLFTAFDVCSPVNISAQQPTGLPTKQLAKQRTNQPTNQPASQSVNQAANIES